MESQSVKKNMFKKKPVLSHSHSPIYYGGQNSLFCVIKAIKPTGPFQMDQSIVECLGSELTQGTGLSVLLEKSGSLK